MVKSHIPAIAVILLVITHMAFPISTVFAAKKLIRAPKAAPLTFSKVSLSRSTHSAVVSFFNLNKVKRVEYSLSYDANGISQGVMGSFIPSGQSSDNRDLYFGTCSKGVCTPHYGIEKASLIVKTTLTTGASNTKRYLFKRV
jgi:hypothetical protein